jgi:hypothetical protein
MKKIQSKILLRAMAACLLLATFTGCKKEFLDLSPYTALPPSEAFKTEADLRVAMNGVYNGLRATDLFGRTVPVLGDIMADNIYQHSINSNRYTQFNLYTVSVADGNAAGLWIEAYRTMLRANNIINSELTGTPGITQIKGEAKAVRALLYFTLVRFFARPFTDNPSALGVPLVLTYDLSLKAGRATVDQVYTQILKDLGEAYNDMTTFTNSSQMHKWAARALEAKVRLNRNDMAGALTAANDVIANSGFTVVGTSNMASYWSAATFRTDRLETLFEVSMDAVGNQGFDALTNIYNQLGYGDLLVASDLYATFTTTDVRRNLHYLAVAPSNRAGGIVVDKYKNLSSERDETKILRMSDVYLIAAEASAATNVTNAQGFLNYILTRRDPAAAPYTSTGQQLINDILLERRKEFIAEGDRFHDLNRLKMTVSRNANFPASARTIEYSNFRRLLPIPETETNANEVIKAQQNPGYQ